MPQNKNAYLRYLLIHSQIKRNKYKYGYPTLLNLYDYLKEESYEVSISTIEKDLKFLKYEREAPLIYDHKQKCYRYTREWEFDVPISPGDIRMLKMLVRKLEIFGEAKEFKMLEESIYKMSSHLELIQHHPNDKIDKYILFEYSKGFTGKHLLSKLYDAIYEKKEISFTHCRYETDIATERLIEPYSLKEHRNRWYIIGKENGEPKIFGLDRISDLEIIDRHFIQDPDFYDEIFQVLYDAVGVMAFNYNSEDVVLHFDRAETEYIKSLMLHRSQEIIKDDEEGLTIKMHVKVTHEFIMECILRFGKYVRVIKPISLAKQVEEIYHSALDLYKS